jgi:hypothetical protein
MSFRVKLLIGLALAAFAASHFAAAYKMEAHAAHPAAELTMMHAD